MARSTTATGNIDDGTFYNSDEQESIHRHPLHVAALNGDTAALRMIITYELDRLELDRLEFLVDCNCTSLRYAIVSHRLECVQILLENGSDPVGRGQALSGNGSDIVDNDAVTVAAVLSHAKFLAMLLGFGLWVLALALVKAAAINRTK